MYRNKRRYHMNPNNLTSSPPQARTSLLSLIDTYAKPLLILFIILFLISISLVIALTKQRSDLQKKLLAQNGLDTAQGIYTLFTASAQGTVAKINDTQVEVENNGKRQTFTISSSVFVASNRFPISTASLPTQSVIDQLFNSLEKVLISTVDAQSPATTSSQRLTTPKPTTAPTPMPTPQQTKTASPAATPQQKTIKDIKTGDHVLITLSKQKMADPWRVVSIFVQSKGR